MTDRPRLRRAFLASLLLHALLWPALLALIFSPHMRDARYGARESIITIATRTSIHRPAVPPRTPRRIVTPEAALPSVVAVRKSVRPIPARVQHHVLARADVHALTSQPKSTTALTPETIGLQEQAFAKAIARARVANDPVANSATSGAGPQAKRYSYDYSNSQSFSHGDGYLDPVRSWHSGPYTYYYLHYEVTYPDGSPESGVVPWPVRYLPGDDPFARGLREKIPLNGPLPDFVPDASVAMKPLVKYCFERRLASCPIAHD